MTKKTEETEEENNKKNEGILIISNVKEKLTLDEEIQLILLAKNNIDFKEKVFSRYKYMIYKIGVMKYFNSDFVDKDDIIQCGFLGIDRAIKEFNPDRRKRFSTVAHHWILESISNYYRDNSRPYSIAHSVTDKLSAIRKFENKFESLNNREPTRKEIGRELGVPEGKINYLFRYRQEPISFDLVSNDVSENLGAKDFFGTKIPDNNFDNPYEHAARLDGIKRIRNGFEKLDDDEKFILNSRYSLNLEDNKNPLTYLKISKILQEKYNNKFSPNKVKKIEQNATAKLKIWMSI